MFGVIVMVVLDLVLCISVVGVTSKASVVLVVLAIPVKLTVTVWSSGVVSPDKADYIIMTNRVSRHHGIKNCFDIFKGNDIALVKRNGLILSVIRKIKL